MLPAILATFVHIALIFRVKRKKVNQNIAVSGNHLTTTGNHMPYGITQCYLPPGSGDFPGLPQLKLELDLATLDGCKPELT